MIFDKSNKTNKTSAAVLSGDTAPGNTGTGNLSPDEQHGANARSPAAHLQPGTRHKALLAAVMAAMVGAVNSAQADVRKIAELEFADVPVGEVSLVLGRAWIESEGKSRKLATPGSAIRPTDRIHTEANGHVHIRFVDEALVSVRPDSRLQIVDYQYNPDQPQLSTIKLQLDEGVTRSISGRGASSARDRFRLNTPIAAIGVRGTDFVVSATQTSVRALVNEGAIVLAPFSSDCLAAAYGPCAFNALELSSSSLEMIEMDGTSATPRLIPAAQENTSELESEELRMHLQLQLVGAPEEDVGVEDKTVATGTYLENVTSRRVQNEVTNVMPPAPTPAPGPAPNFMPSSPLSEAVLTQNQLTWGRFGAGQGVNERITVTTATARIGREAAVSDGIDYMLYRAGNGGPVQAGLGPVSFSLDSAQAFYHSASGVVAMEVSGGKLDINFNSSTFYTQLNMHHTLTGSVDFTASGQMLYGGFFRNLSGTERIAGAVTLDGKEAGYFFEKQLESGGIQGLTLWDKP